MQQSWESVGDDDGMSGVVGANRNLRNIMNGIQVQANSFTACFRGDLQSNALIHNVQSILRKHGFFKNSQEGGCNYLEWTPTVKAGSEDDPREELKGLQEAIRNIELQLSANRVFASDSEYLRWLLLSLDLVITEHSQIPDNISETPTAGILPSNFRPIRFKVQRGDGSPENDSLQTGSDAVETDKKLQPSMQVSDNQVIDEIPATFNSSTPDRGAQPLPLFESAFVEQPFASPTNTDNNHVKESRAPQIQESKAPKASVVSSKISKVKTPSTAKPPYSFRNRKRKTDEKEANSVDRVTRRSSKNMENVTFVETITPKKKKKLHHWKKIRLEKENISLEDCSRSSDDLQIQIELDSVENEINSQHSRSVIEDNETNSMDVEVGASISLNWHREDISVDSSLEQEQLEHSQIIDGVVDPVSFSPENTPEDTISQEKHTRKQNQPRLKYLELNINVADSDRLNLLLQSSKESLEILRTPPLALLPSCQLPVLKSLKILEIHHDVRHQSSKALPEIFPKYLNLQEVFPHVLSLSCDFKGFTNDIDWISQYFPSEEENSEKTLGFEASRSFPSVTSLEFKHDYDVGKGLDVRRIFPHLKHVKIDKFDDQGFHDLGFGIDGRCEFGKTMGGITSLELRGINLNNEDCRLDELFTGIPRKWCKELENFHKSDASAVSIAPQTTDAVSLFHNLTELQRLKIVFDHLDNCKLKSSLQSGDSTSAYTAITAVSCLYGFSTFSKLKEVVFAYDYNLPAASGMAEILEPLNDFPYVKIVHEVNEAIREM